MFSNKQTYTKCFLNFSLQKADLKSKIIRFNYHCSYQELLELESELELSDVIPVGLLRSTESAMAAISGLCVC